MAFTKEKARKLHEVWKNDLLAFVEDFLGRDLTHEIPDFHKEIYGFLPKARRVALAAPRGFAKSKICSKFYPIHQALFQQKQDICLISASEGLAVEWLRQIRSEFETNKYILGFYGDLKSPKWTENHIVLNNPSKTTLRARGAGGQIRGFRPDCLILDDVETDESVVSEEQRRKLREWIFKACLNTLLPHGQFIMIGTIISPLALLEEILKTDNGWTKRRYQAYCGGDQREGNELWPQLWNHEKLQSRKKEIGSFAFSSEYLNNPVLNEAAPIKPHQIRCWENLPDDLNCVIAVDPAYSDDEKADYKVAVLVGVDTQNRRYLINYIRTHSPSGEFIDSVINLYLQNKGRTGAVGIPCSGTEREFFNSFVQKAHGRGVFEIPVVELKNVFNTATGVSVRKKEHRIIAALQPLFEAGKYYIHANHEEAKNELLTIGVSRWDDIVDAMAYTEQIITPNYSGFSSDNKIGRYGEPLPEELNTIPSDYGHEW